jgi:SAM-dependent methyltransferase
LVLRREDTCLLYSLVDGREGTAVPKGSHEVPRAIGSHDYRAFVGPPEKYDVVGAMQFSLLVAVGLREHHSLLDVGCGSLRAGRLFLAYLLPGRYYGIEPEEWLVREGAERELGIDVLRVKRPTFNGDRDFTLSAFGAAFDFIVAQSIFSHASSRQIRRCLAEAAKVMKPRALFAATFCESRVDHAGDEWVYPGCVTYTYEHLNELAEEHGLGCVRLAWPHPNGQQWVVFFRPGAGTVPEALMARIGRPKGGTP